MAVQWRLLGISCVSEQFVPHIVGFINEQPEKSESAPQAWFQGNSQPGIWSEENPTFSTICLGQLLVGSGIRKNAESLLPKIMLF